MEVSLSEADGDCGGSDGDANEVENSDLEDLGGLSVDDILKKKTMRGIESLCKELQMDCRAFGSSMNRTEEYVREANPVVRDPVVAKTKGAPKIPKKKALGKRRRCTGCKGLGHTKRNCPDKGAGRQNPDQAEECGGINATCVISNDDWESIVGDNLCAEPGGKFNAD
ncbi:hypothetical protein S83_062109 [Arachis hypogaea]